MSVYQPVRAALGRLRWLVVLAVVVPLAACGQAGETVVPYTADVATVAVGDVLVVDFGAVNSSIGDGWQLTTPPDADVLAVGEFVDEYTGSDARDGQAPLGASSHLVHTFTAKAAGTTTIGFTYSYRSEVGDPEGRTEDPTPEITVTVVD